MIKMTTNELIEMCRNDRKKVKSSKVHYGYLEKGTGKFVVGIINNDKDLMRELNNLDSNNFLVLK